MVVPAAGLARRLPAGLGLALNPDGAPGLPLYPESVSYLARLDQRSPAIGVGHPPTEPLALLNEVQARLRRLRFVRAASRAWLSVPDRGEGLVIAVALDDPASEPAHRAVIGALIAAVASVPLHVPFPVDVTFPGEPAADDPALRPTARPAPPPAARRALSPAAPPAERQVRPAAPPAERRVVRPTADPAAAPAAALGAHPAPTSSPTGSRATPAPSTPGIDPEREP